MSDLKPNVFTMIGLLLAVITFVFYGLAIGGFTGFGVPGVFTMLGGGLFLWLGANDQVSAQNR
jgi:hypothetical protein